MTNISYFKGNILTTKNYKRVIIHSCNVNGSWGGGIAYQLAVKYPKTEAVYVDLCERYANNLLGKCVVIPSFKDNDTIIGCLFTSSFGGVNHGSATSILEYTEKSLECLNELLTESPHISANTNLDNEIGKLITQIEGNLNEYRLEMPKINSGIFGVPWQRTERVLEKFNGSLSFTVYEI